MELLSKLTDAGAMFWHSLDDRERFLVLYAGAYLCVVAATTLMRRERSRRDQQLFDRLRNELEVAHRGTRPDPA